jgi:CheY-like chemotaxis protein
VRADLEEVLRAADRAAALTRQLLAFSRRQVLQPRVLDVNVVVSDMGTMLRRLIGEDVTVAMQLDAAAPRVVADRGQLEQVIMNLVVNARDAMPGGGTVQVHTSLHAVDVEADDDMGSLPPGRYAEICVADTGIGMEPSVLTRIFEPFFTTKELGRGTGLGLPTVYGIVTQSGGSVEVRSRPGEGSTFSICLPRVDADPQPAAPPDPAAVQGGSETLLLVDDSEPVLALTGRILSRAGYEVITAPSGEWALSVAARHPASIDLLITDVMMPGMSGPQLAERLARSRSGLRVMYMTGYQRAAPDGTSMVPEGAAVIEKPFKPDALLRQVRQVLSET